MVAIVSGNSLGLGLTSFGTLGQDGTSGSAAQGQSGERVYLNAATGNLVVQRTDDLLASHGTDAEALRTYNSQGLFSDDNADNWSLGVYAQQLLLSGTVNASGSTVTVTARDGSQAVYAWEDARSCYVTREGGGAHDTLVYNSATSQFERKDGDSGTVERYAAATGRLSSVTDADGNTSNYTYDTTTGLLSKVVDRSGDTLWYDYTGNQLTGLRTQFVDGTGATVFRSTVRYAYDTSGRLSAVTVDLTPEDGNIADGKVYTTSYTYDGSSKRLKSLTQTDGSVLSFTYVLVGSDYRVATVTNALGAVTQYAYDTAVRRTTVTDPLGQTWRYDYDTAGQLTRISTPEVAGTRILQSYAYDADGNVTSFTNGDAETV